MLESKISEAGPFPQRAQPVSITDAIRSLKLRNTIRTEIPDTELSTPAYSLASADSQIPASRRDQILQAYSAYTTAAGDDKMCAQALETVVHNSLTSSSSFSVLHSEVVHGRPKQIAIGTSTLDNSAPLDHVARHDGTGLVFGIEDKNYREWIYPDSHVPHLKRFLSKCIRNNITGLLITRKLPYVTRLFLKRLGVLGFETHHQYFNPNMTTALKEARSSDGLGFHDISFTTEENPNLTTYLNHLNHSTLTSYAEMFDKNRSAIEAFAVQDTIGYQELLNEIGLPWKDLEGEAYDYEPW
ncbi:MAG TPA: hypothetical protein VIP09_14845 [Dehalococcoidia bacterium]|jgi:hypothetical protein